MPDSVPGVKLVSMIDESGSTDRQLMGVLVSLAGLPPAVPFRRCELYTDISNCVIETVLRTEGVLREGHAQDAWQTVNRSTVDAREPSLKNLFSLPTAEDLRELVEKHREEQRERERQMLAAATSGSVAESTADTAIDAAALEQARPRKGLRMPGMLGLAGSSSAVAAKAKAKAAAAAGLLAGPKAKPAQRRTRAVSDRLGGNTAFMSICGDIDGGSSRSCISGKKSAASNAASEVVDDLDVAKILSGEQEVGTKLNGVRAFITV